MALDKQTVAIPFVSGIQPSTRARLLDPAKLLVAENCQYTLDQGPQKRNGHSGRVVRTSASYIDMAGVTIPGAAPPRETFSTANPNLPATWTYGWGVRDPSPTAAVTNYASTLTTNEVSPFPDVGQLFGAVARDDEAVVWDGHRLFSYTPGQSSKFGEAMGKGTTISPPLRGPLCAPALRSTPIAKVTTGQLFPDACDNGTLRLVVWANTNGTSFSYSVYDSNSGACLISAEPVALSSIKSLRCICVGAWFHMLSADSANNTFGLRSFHQDNPASVTVRSLGAVDDNIDVKKIDENTFATLQLKTNTMTVVVLNADGSTQGSFVASTAGGGVPAANSPICLGVDSRRNLALLWASGAGSPWTVWLATYTLGGLKLTIDNSFGTVNALRHLTMSPKLVAHNTQPTQDIWAVYGEQVSSGIPRVDAKLVYPGLATASSLQAVYRTVIASHAFSVGDRSFLWCASWLGNTLGLQNTWFLCDENLLPVGKMSYGQANPDLIGTTYVLKCPNWHTDDSTQLVKDRVVFHGALGYNVRVQTAQTSASPNGVFVEPSINFYQLDFLPKLRYGQAGRTTYIAGAQLWAYDGTEAVEAGFHMAPEGVTGVAAGSGGFLSAGTYRYRIDLCHKNAQNEEVRSWSLVTAPITAVNNDSITLTIPTMPMTRKKGSYFLIFRTVANGTVFFLANDRNPAGTSFRANDTTVPSVTFLDVSSDASILPREYHPANAGGNYVDPLPPPACEIVAAGRGRLWLAGGELARGEVAPSRLFAAGETPAFSPALNIQVDRNFEPITAIGFLGEIGVFFRRTNAYILDTDGPDNSLNGAWGDPRLAIADTGCVAHETLALTTVGLWFQSPAGLRLFSNSGALDQKAGQDVDPLAIVGNYAAAVVVPQHTQVRWYSRDNTKPTLVLDYSSNTWTTWTGVTAVGAIFWPVTDLAVLARGDGFLWQEQDGAITDNGAAIEMRVKLSWLHAAQLGDFQRFRRFALYGKCAQGTTLRIRIFYDERDFHDEEMLVDFPVATGVTGSEFNESVWGGPAWGIAGAWGDDSNTTELQGSAIWFKDGVFKFRRRPGRQKCSVFSLEFSDQGALTRGFEPVVLALELGVKPGLERIPSNG